MENLKLKGKEGKISAENAIEPEELNMLWKAANANEKVTIACVGYAGMRESEYLHMEPSWIHFDDGKTKKYGSPLIHIPGSTKKFKQLCNCDDCQLRAYRDYRKKKADEENDDKHVKHNLKWYRKVSEDFYKLKPERISKHSNEMSRIKDLGLQGYWRPKSVKGSRYIPLVLEDIQEAIRNYKDNYEELKPKRKRLDVWWSVRKLGRDVLDKDIYPHSLRASYISILGSSPEMTLNKLITLSGHKSFTSVEPYMLPDRKEAIRTANNISKELFCRTD